MIQEMNLMVILTIMIKIMMMGWLLTMKVKMGMLPKVTKRNFGPSLYLLLVTFKILRVPETFSEASTLRAG